MGKETSRTVSKALIVIPDWGLAWHVYCLEHAVKLAKSGMEVSLLDLSNLNPRIFKRRFFRLVLSLAQRNRLEDIKRIISRDYRINLLGHTLTKYQDSLCVLTKAREDIFLSAIASKYSNLTGQRGTQISDLDQEIVDMERYFFNSTVDIILYLQSQHNFNEIFTVNGRYIVDGAVVQASMESKVKCSLIESAGSTPGLYEVYQISPHDIPSVQEMHKELWAQAAPGREIIAEKGLTKKLSGMDTPGFNFRANFTEEFKQTNDATSQKLAVFFPSSDREFAIFPAFNWRDSFGGSQGDAFLSFCRLAKANDYRVVVRVHPVDSKSPQELQDQFAKTEDAIWQKLCATGGALMIESRSQVSSYDLIEKADLCVTYASSIAVECILSDKPTLILGESEISYCVPEICAFNEVELESKFTEGIPVVRREALYPYGYWLESAGTNLNLFNFVSDHEVYFGGKLVNEFRHWAKALLYFRGVVEQKKFP
jgi:hypothetical protein